MEKYNINIKCEDNEFFDLNIKNQSQINQWLFNNKNIINTIDDDYLVSDLSDIKEKYRLDQNIPLTEFIEKNKTKIETILNDGLSIYVKIYNEEHEDVYKGLLNIGNDDNIIIKDDYENTIYINNKKLEVDCRILKIISKYPKFITVKDFILNLKDNKLLFNSIITLFLNNSTKVISINVTNGEIEKPETINGRDNELIIRFTIRYQ